MEGIGSGFAQVFFGFAIVVALIFGGIVFGVTKFFQKKEIVTKTLITPKIRLTTDGKTVDTLYVYPIK